MAKSLSIQGRWPRVSLPNILAKEANLISLQEALGGFLPFLPFGCEAVLG